MRVTFEGGSRVEDIAETERIVSEKIRESLNAIDPESGQSLLSMIVRRSNHSIKDGDIDKDYASIQLDPFGGDVLYGEPPCVTPRLSFKRESHLDSNPVTLKFSRIMSDASSNEIVEKLWSQIPDASKKAIVVKVTKDELEKRMRSKERALKEGIRDDSGEHYLYQDEFYILFLTACLKGLNDNEFEFKYGIDANLQYTLHGNAAEMAKKVCKAYGISSMDAGEYETLNGHAKPTTQEVLEGIKKELGLQSVTSPQTP